jgi:hypothetical protein
MKQEGVMKYNKRLLKLEKLAITEECIPAVAIRFLDGKISWSDHIFTSEDEFNRAVVVPR